MEVFHILQNKKSLILSAFKYCRNSLFSPKFSAPNFCPQFFTCFFLFQTYAKCIDTIRPGFPQNVSLWRSHYCLDTNVTLSDIVLAKIHTGSILVLVISNWPRRVSLTPAWIIILLYLHLSLTSCFKLPSMSPATQPPRIPGCSDCRETS